MSRIFRERTTKYWTLAELRSLPYDGHRYELVRGDLFVTPLQDEAHETVVANIQGILMPFVRTHGLGHVYRPRTVLCFEDSQVEPDLQVRRPAEWDFTNHVETAFTPSLVVEVTSEYTWNRDHDWKRELYRDAGVNEYWIVDRADRRLDRIRGDQEERVTDRFVWSPAASNASLTIELADVFAWL